MFFFYLWQIFFFYTFEYFWAIFIHLTNVNIPKDSGFFVVCEGSLNQEIFLIKVIDKPLPQKCRKLSKKYRYHTYTNKILFFQRIKRIFSITILLNVHKCSYTHTYVFISTLISRQFDRAFLTYNFSYMHFKNEIGHLKLLSLDACKTKKIAYIH